MKELISKKEGEMGMMKKKLKAKIVNKLMLILAVSSFVTQPIAAFANDGTTVENETSDVIETEASTEQTETDVPVEEYLAQNHYAFGDNGKLKSTNGTEVREDVNDVLGVLEQEYGYRTSSLTRGAGDVYIDADYNIKSVSWVYSNGEEGSRWFSKHDSSGNRLWCIEPGAPLYAGENTGFSLGEDTSEKLQRVSLAAYFGYEKQKSVENAFYTEKYTQELATGIGIKSISDTEGKVSLAGYKSYKTEVEKKIRTFYTKPSFAGQNIKIDVGQTITLTDTNNSLSAYKITSKPAEMTIKQYGNVLTITANEATNVSNLNFAFDIDSDYVGATVVYKHSTLQNVVSGRVYNPTQFSLNAVVEPDVKTTATDAEDGDKELSPEEQVTIVDNVEYKNLYTDGREYTVKGKLMDKETGEPLLVDGQEITAEKTFVPEKPDGTTPLSFTFNASALAGKTVVVFEDLLTENIQVATHSDITDEGQTVTFDNPKIGTTATNQVDGSKLVDPEKKVTFVDTVAYSDLQIGKNYKISGVLMDKATGEPLLVDGEPVTAETAFTPEAADGTVEVVFEFDASSVAGDLVVFEMLDRQHSMDEEYRFVTEHKDIEDEGQTIKVTDPKIGTQATNANDGTQIAEPLEEITINDEVSYENLIEGKVYTVTGTLMDKSTGEPLMIDKKKVTASTTFIAGAGEVSKEEAADTDGMPINLVSGKVTVVFTFAGINLHNKEVVVFESLKRNDTEVAVHADINDEKQTITFTEPKIGTNATNANDGTKLFDPLEKVTLNDEVSYENLVEGQVYTVTGVLMDKKTGRPLSADGKNITASATFIAGVGEVSKDKAKDIVHDKKNLVSGKVNVVFTFNGGNLQGREIVVFESLLREEFEIAAHADINDGKQTVKFSNPLIPFAEKTASHSTKNLPSSGTSAVGSSTSSASLPKTGSSKSWYIMVFGLILVAFTSAFYYRRKKIS